MKKSGIIIPGLALALFLAWPLAPAQAQNQGAEPGPPSGYSQKLDSLSDQLWAKQMELEALVQAGNAKEAKAVTDEIIKLRNQIRDERRQLAGSDWGGGRGWGPGDGPYYHGGRGWKGRGGHGRWGHCWW
jgi:hypothetical protein